jgi:hypothetical protein
MELPQIVLHTWGIRLLNWTMLRVLKVTNLMHTKKKLFSCVSNHTSGSVLHRRTMWHSREPDCPPVALHTPSQKRNVSLSHLPTVAHSAVSCTKTSHHYRFPIQFWLRPQSAVLNVAPFPWTSCYYFPCCTDNSFSMNRCSTFTSLPSV